MAIAKRDAKLASKARNGTAGPLSYHKAFTVMGDADMANVSAAT